MSGKAIGISMNYGFPGTYARTPDDIVTSRQLKEGSADVPFGMALCANGDNTYSPVGDDFTAAKFGGVALRVVKQATAYDDQTATAYHAKDLVNAINRGAVVVTCNHGTPTAGGSVYVRIKENSSIPAGVVGGFEAEADSTNTVQLTNVQWTNGYVDANGVAEITILTRLNA
ncbi:structural cement protein Gp24 [Acidaminococcus provencensis]|uniref:structural cement protein Gp24 n=1 Tax=Acidaminococcus provencensis TaxID=2058289 RepID=UPI000CF9F369|nr:hypothetical protein [Acidaminococcus provencensis]